MTASIRRGARLKLRSVSVLLGTLLMASAARAAAPAPALLGVPEPRVRIARAAAYAATAATLYQEGDLSGALRFYERAWWWDPTSPERLARIVSLAFSLERPEEAIRYALLGAERGATDGALLRRMALYATEAGDWRRASRLYRRWLFREGPSAAGRIEPLMVRLEAARLTYLDGDPAGAADVLAPFSEILAASTSDPNGASEVHKRVRDSLGGSLRSALELMIRCNLESDRIGEAQRGVEALQSEADAGARVGYWRAKIALARGDAVTAIDLLQRYLESQDLSLGRLPYQALDESLRRIGEASRYPTVLTAVVTQQPNNPDALHALAIALEAGGDRRGAVEACNRLAAWGESPATEDGRPPVDLDAYTEACNLLLRDAIDNRDTPAVLRVCRGFHDNIGGIEGLRETLTRGANDADLAAALLARLAADSASSPDAVDPAFNARLAVAAERFEVAARWYREAIDKADQQQRPALSTEWVSALLDKKLYQDAAGALRWSIERQVWPQNSGAPHYFLAGTLEMLGETDAALDEARLAAQAEPGSAEFASRLGWVLAHAERNAEAAEAYRKLLSDFADDQDPATREVLRDARYALSGLAMLLKQSEESEEWLAQVLDEFPDDYGVKNDLGYLWADRGVNLGLARRLIEEALAEEPDNPAYWDSLGWVKFRQGRVEEAVRDLRKSVKLADAAGLEEGDGVLYEHLGDAYAATDQMNQARASWNRAAQMLAEVEPERAAEARKKAGQGSERAQQAP